MPILWQGSGEQKWRAGDLNVPHVGDDIWSQELDFVWTDQGDSRRLRSANHIAKLTICGSREELARLTPLLVDFLNAYREPEQMPREPAPAG